MQLSIPKDYSLEETGITQSLLKKWKTCRRAFLFSINRMHPTCIYEKWAYHNMMHAALEFLYKGNKMFDVFLTNYKLSVPKDEIQKTKSIAQAMLSRYLEFYGKDFTEKRFTAVEKEFAVRFGNYLLRGKCDGKFKDKKGRFYHIEHKNYSQINVEVLAKILKFDLQNNFYALADSIEGKRDIHGVLYNVLRVPQSRKEISPRDLLVELSEKIRKDPKHYFFRFEIMFHPSDLKDFEGTLRHQLSELYACLHTGVHCFYQNENACQLRGTCEYLDICSSGSFVGYEKIDTFFPELEE
jgi:hypothetical protein